MNSSLARLTLGTVAASAALGLAAVPAQAASGSVGYTCSIVSFHSEPEGPTDGFAMTAKFDSAIEDGVKVPVGTTVRLSQVPGQFTFSAPLVAAMRDLGVPAGMADATMDSYFMQGLEKSPTTYTEMEFDFSGGAATIHGPGKAAAYTVRTEGAHTFAAGKVAFKLSHRDGFALGTITCEVAEGEEPAIDAVFGVAAAPTPTPTVTTGGPLRPEVVQTDAAQPSNDAGMPSALVAGAALLALSGAAGARRVLHRGANR